MSKTKSIVIKGKCKWAKVWETGTYQGTPTGYSIEVAPESDEEVLKVLATLQNVWDDYKDDVLKDKKFSPKEGFLYLGGTAPDEDDADQKRYFKAKRKHEFKDRETGKIKPITIPIFDCYNVPMQKGTLIGNGSEVEISVRPKVYAMKKDTYGVSLQLLAVRVNKLVEFNKDATSYGFSESEEPTPFDDDIDF